MASLSNFGINYLLIAFVITYVFIPTECQDVSQAITASMQTLLNEETVLRTKIENEMRQLSLELSTLQQLKQNGKHHMIISKTSQIVLDIYLIAP